MKKKVVSLLLSAALVFSLLSVPAFAEEPDAAPDAPAAEAEVAESSVETSEEAAPEMDETNKLVLPGKKTTDSTIDDAAAAADSTDPVAPIADPQPTKPVVDGDAATTDTKDSQTKKQITYVALGDSIVAGVGLADVQYKATGVSTYGVDMRPNFTGYSPDCYVGKVATMLGLDRDHAIDLGLPALTAPDLVDMVRDGKMPKMNMESGCYYVYPEFQDYIRKADVISIQIGSNDAFVPCIVALGNATNWKSEKLAATILGGELRSSGSALSTIRKSIKNMGLTKDEKNATWQLLTSEMSKICDRVYPQTTSSLISVVQEIRKLNPDCQILLMGYTDPVPFISCWHNYFKKLNKFEKELAETYNLTYVPIPKAKTDLDVHPTIEGHEYIAKKIVKSIDVNG